MNTSNIGTRSILKRIAASANVAEGLLVKRGSTAGESDICAATDAPLGVSLDTPASGEEFAVVPLITSETVRCIASGAILADADVYAAAGGKIQALPAGAGTYQLVGIALNAASVDGDVVEVLLSSAGKTTTVSA